MSQILLGATGLINTLVAVALSRSQSKSTDNYLLMHYFLFNTANTAFSVAPSCDLVGYGQQISTLGSSLSMALITYRSMALAKHSNPVWTMLIWIPVLTSSLFAYSDGSSFVSSNSVFACIKDYHSSLPVWTILTSSLIFLSVISLILGLTAIVASFSNPQLTVAKKRAQYQRLMATILIDSAVSFSVAVAGMVMTVQKVDDPLMRVFQPVVNLSRLLLLPLFFLVLHKGLRRELFRVMTFQSPVSSERQTTVGPVYNKLDFYPSKEPVRQNQTVKSHNPTNSQYQQHPQPQPQPNVTQPLRVDSDYFPHHAREDSFKVDFSAASSPATSVSYSNSHSRLPSHENLPPLPTKTTGSIRIANSASFDTLSTSQRVSSYKYAPEPGPTSATGTRSADIIASQEQKSPRIKISNNVFHANVQTSGKSESVEMLSENSVRPRAPSNTRPKTPTTAKIIVPKARIAENV